jgi:hypothetical protein
MDRRRTLGLLGSVAAYAAVRPLAPAIAKTSASMTDQSESFDVTSFRETHDRDDTASFSRALRRGSKIYVPQGKGSGPGGVYHVSGLTLPSNVEIFGDGPNSIVRPGAPERSPCMLVGSRTGGELTAGITIKDIAFEGYSVEHGFSEHRHLVSLHGIAKVRLLGLTLRGFQGDAIYLGSGESPHNNLKNRDVVIQDCLFDGLNHQNRNAISVINCVGIRISRCRFKNCSRLDMPGPIDFEPNHPGLEKVGQIYIGNCSFNNCGGMAGQIAIIVPKAEASFVEYATVEMNKFEDYVGVGADIHIDVQPPTDREAKPSHRLIIRNNKGNRGNRPLVCKAGASIDLVNNNWADYANASIIGNARGPTVQHLKMSDSYRKVGSGSGESPALDIRDFGSIRISQAKFFYCGSPVSEVIRFFDGTAGNFVVSNTKFVSNSRSARRIMFVERGYKISRIRPSDFLRPGHYNSFTGFYALDSTSSAAP